MAFTTSNVKTTVFGNLRVTVGDWTGSVGDSSGSIGVGGGRVYLSNFEAQGTDQPFNIDIPSSVSTSGNVTTVTVYYQQAVTTGRFLIISA